MQIANNRQRWGPWGHPRISLAHLQQSIDSIQKDDYNANVPQFNGGRHFEVPVLSVEDVAQWKPGQFVFICD